MPTYLCHGFRWHRYGIRRFVIFHDLEDAAPDWIIGRTSSSAILSQFYDQFDFLPKLELAPPLPPIPPQRKGKYDDSNKELLHYYADFALPPSKTPNSEDHVLVHETSAVKLLEEYDVAETTLASRPYAYVADYAVRVDLSAIISDQMAKYKVMTKVNGEDWFKKLRDELQADEDIGWHVVVCGDDERAASEISDDEDTDRGSSTPVQERFRAASSTSDMSSSSASAQSGSEAAAPRHNSERLTPQHSLRHKSSQAFRRIFRKKDT